jgi:hypothetical protein
MCRYYFKTESSDGADRWTLGDRPPMGVSGGVDCNADDSAGAAGSMMCSWDDERTKQTTYDFEWCHKSQTNCESYHCNRGSSSKWVRFHHRGCAGGGYSPQVCDESWGSPLAFCTFFGVGFPNFSLRGSDCPSWFALGLDFGGVAFAQGCACQRSHKCHSVTVKVNCDAHSHPCCNVPYCLAEVRGCMHDFDPTKNWPHVHLHAQVLI